jgi:hypothetical protein
LSIKQKFILHLGEEILPTMLIIGNTELQSQMIKVEMDGEITQLISTMKMPRKIGGDIS